MVYPQLKEGAGVLHPLRLSNFTGFNLTEDPSSLPSGYLVDGDRDIDLSRSPGALAKRRGIEGQAPSLGIGEVLGLHTFRAVTGDRLFFGYNGSLYELTGLVRYISKTTTADFALGTHQGTEAVDNNIQLGAGYLTGTWTSPVYDLGSTPSAINFDWTDTVVAGVSTVSCNLRASEDGVNFGAYNATIKGAAVPLGRFYQVRYVLTTTDIATHNPKVHSFQLNYSTVYDVATLRLSDLTGEVISADTYGNQWYFCDSDRPRRYTGVTFYLVGVDPPASAPTLAAGDAGGLSGDYQGLVTFVNNLGTESLGGLVSGTVTVASQKINWSSIPVGPAGTVSRKLYRSKAGDYSAFYFVATIANNTTTVYVDDTADTALVTPLPEDNAIPPDSTIIYSHKDYMLYVPVTNPNRLYFSKRGLPDSVPVTAYKEFPGTIRAIRTYHDALVVGGYNFTAAVYGDLWDADPAVDNTVVRVISENTGPVAQSAMRVVSTPKGDILVFPTLQQVVYLTPGLQENSLQSVPLSDKVAPVFAGAMNRYKMAAIYHDSRYIIALNNTTETIYTNNILMVYDTRTGEWSPPWNIAAAGFAEARGRVYFGSPNIGRVYELNKATSDDGAAINGVAVLKTEYTKEGPQHKKRFAHVRIGVTPNSVTDTLELKPEVDGSGATLTPGSVSGWRGGYVSPRQRINLSRGHQYDLTVEDDSVHDWLITEIVTEYERG